jgi:glutathione S-transferase
MPRPDIRRLGVKYRRIPILAIGRDVYLDTRLILKKLQSLESPDQGLSALTSPEHRAIQQLLEAYVVDAGLFQRATHLMPANLPMFKSKTFVADRADLSGGKFDGAMMAAARPVATNEFKRAFELLEKTLLSDGRNWVCDTPKPSVADIEAVWPFAWVASMPGGFDSDHISAAHFPKVFAWMERFQSFVGAAQKAMPEPRVRTVSGEEAARLVSDAAPPSAAADAFDDNDPVVKARGLKKGQQVLLFPSDYGSSHKDVGKLVAINGVESVVETDQGETPVRIHAPRHGFHLVPHKDKSVL